MTDHPLALGVASILLGLIAQVVDRDNATVPSIVTSMTSTGVLVWYLWYSVTKVIPGLTEKFSQELKALRETFSQAQEHLREQHNRELTQLRLEYRRMPEEVPKKEAGD